MKSNKLKNKIAVLAVTAAITVPGASLYAQTAGNTCKKPGVYIKYYNNSCTGNKPGNNVNNGTDNKPGNNTDNGTDNKPGNNVNNGTGNKPGNNTDNGTGNKPDNDTDNGAGSNINADSQTAYENKVLELVNQQRAKNGLNPLQMDEKLRETARLKSTDMKNKNYFSHTSPTYGTPFEMMKSFGISYKKAAENIAMGYASPEAVVNGWMNSQGHRANILNASFTHIGIGYEASGNYWTQMFIAK